jgi:hypothetical protein
MLAGFAVGAPGERLMPVSVSSPSTLDWPTSLQRRRSKGKTVEHEQSPKGHKSESDLCDDTDLVTSLVTNKKSPRFRGLQ